MEPRKPVTEMSGSEVAALLAPLTRTQLIAMLIHLSGYAPDVFEDALSRYGTEEGQH